MTRCEKVLNKLGMRVSLKGYQYWIEAINYLSDITARKELLKMCALYHYIAKKYNDTPARVERALRYAVDSTPKLIEVIKQRYGITYKLNNTMILRYLAKLVEEVNEDGDSKISERADLVV